LSVPVAAVLGQERMSGLWLPADRRGDSGLDKVSFFETDVLNTITEGRCAAMVISSRVVSRFENLLRSRAFQLRHARLYAGHPRLCSPAASKTWMAGTSPAMTLGS
jgi:hypothetical protein